MGDSGSRMERQQASTPEAPRRILSDEAVQYTDQVVKFQQAAVSDPYLNGADALRRLRSPGD
jgi:hypothetical protein